MNPKILTKEAKTQQKAIMQESSQSNNPVEMEADPCKNCPNNQLAKEQASEEKKERSLVILNQQEMEDMYNDTTKVPTKSKVARAHLMRRELEKNKEYLYCTCGYSALSCQPFCDGTCEKGVSQDGQQVIQGWKPMKFKVTVDQKFWAMCGCKRNKSRGPTCDGSHIDIEDW